MEPKNTMNQLQNSIESFNIKLDKEEERINELKFRSFEIIQSEEQKERGMKRNEESLWDIGGTIN